MLKLNIDNDSFLINEKVVLLGLINLLRKHILQI